MCVKCATSFRLPEAKPPPTPPFLQGAVAGLGMIGWCQLLVPDLFPMARDGALHSTPPPATRPHSAGARRKMSTKGQAIAFPGMRFTES